MLRLRRVPVDTYAISGRPVSQMGRGLAQDRLSYAAALASGNALAAAALAELVS